MSVEVTMVQTVIANWKLVVGRADKLFAGLSDTELEQEVAPGRNRLIYLLGHLTGAHDRMLALLRLGERLHPELDEPFGKLPDRAAAEIPSGETLKAAWLQVNATLLAGVEKLTPAEWIERHADVSEEDFVKEPGRNRLAVFLSRTSHLSFHVGQIILTRKK
ncbi:DinB family protein [Terriglobus saanensis]|uniref:DinB-like domain-containing protein n=1 Tax=Terriglobus saanensis (strain ATCC BAA-1853 / DSM 23119 / SP1PR4) TaxID=401053 RepID=E8V8D7_TERSS|nr:DinB family protein [Terriglobus saanensis]ADV81840.1 hypothetical protein AciPR4_1007 [Terriglobus saanensis SP1PR4]